MEPKSFSASSLHVAQLCLARYKAEQIDRAQAPGGIPALLGTTVHAALETYVKNCILDTKFPATIGNLLDFFRMEYMLAFGQDMETEEFLDGTIMLKAWHKRTDFSSFTVISSEIKSSFPITTTIGQIPFNYIWDRFDQVSETEYRVVDYKTNRWGLNPADLKKKVQPRAYAVAAAIQLKNEGKEVSRIWVEFDMLRHDGPVGIVFSREDNASMWKFINDRAQQIVDTPDDDVKETINAECNFCVRKTSCTAIRKNIAGGGVYAIKSPQEAIDLRATLEWQSKAINATLKDIDALILEQAKAEGVYEYESDMNKMKIGVSSKRAIDPERAEMVLGPDLFKKYGGRSFTIGNFDKLVKGDEITDEQKAQLKNLVYKNTGEPRVSVEPRNPIDED